VARLLGGAGGLLFHRSGEVRESYVAVNGAQIGWVTGLRRDVDGTILGVERERARPHQRQYDCDAECIERVAVSDGPLGRRRRLSRSLALHCHAGSYGEPERGGCLDGGRSADGLEHVFGISDGVRTRVSVGGYTPHVATSKDGRFVVHAVRRRQRP